jgi:signal transduction histidine kinase
MERAPAAQDIARENQELRDALKKSAAELALTMRELEIEAALDRVRNRTLVMKESAELNEAVAVLFQQFQALYLFPTEARTYFCHINADTAVAEVWMTRTNGTVMDSSHQTPLSSSPAMLQYFEAWKRKDPFIVRNYSGEALTEYLKFISSLPHTKADEDYQQLFKSPPEKIVMTDANFLQGNIGIMTFEPLSRDAIDVLVRFADVLEFAYTRFLDLKKAEAQAREAKIEVALEKARSRTMGMQSSDELPEVANVLFLEVQALGIPAWSCGYNIVAEDKKSATCIMSSEGTLQTPFKLRLFGEASFAQMGDFLFSDETMLVQELGDSALEEHYAYMKSFPDLKQTFDQIDELGLSLPKYQINHLCKFAQGFLLFITYEKVPHAYDIFKRFTKVFEQSYTRFLDLKKAEAQARESQIQLALERVRARTMAMQRSEELPEVAALLFQQVKTLGVPQFHCGFNIFEIDDKECIWYPGSADGDILPPCKIPLTEHPVFMGFIESRKRGDELLVYEKGGEYQAGHYRYMLSLPVLGEILQNMLDAGISFPTFQIDHLANFSHGNLLFITSEHFPEMHDTFKRFAKVFEQTYTRFLDLQKAEAHAREIEIDLALERVRAQTMAMHNSEDVGNCILKMFGELTALGVDEGTRFGIGILNHDNENIQLWTATKESEKVKLHIGHLDMSWHPLLKSARKAWLKQVPLHQYILEGEDLVNYYQMINNAPDYRLRVALEKLPQREIHYGFVFDQGFFYAFNSREFDPELIRITQRFSALFGQTYRRYLDLQKAEAQARESQIQLAMERVRARTMAMQHSSELSETSSLLFQQIQSLGVPPWSCGFNIWEQGDTVFTSYMGRPEGVVLDGIKIPLTEEATFIHFQESRDRGDKLFVDVLEGETLEAHYRYFLTIPGIKEAFEKRAQAGERIPTFQINHLANFSHGNLMFITYEHCPEAHDIFTRFAKVFEQTYTRFLDLQKAEAQVRESQIQSALERVRSRTMAMHQSHELSETSSLLFQQIKNLGLNMWSCGFCIWTEDNVVEAWMNADAGGLLPPLQIPFQAEPTHYDIYTAYNQGKSEHQAIWEGEPLERHYAFLETIPSAKTAIEILKASGLSLPEKQCYYVGFFKKGYLLVITKEPDTAALDLTRQFASVFDLTFTRFLDLKNAEAQARDAQIEAALERVRSRSMAMQSSSELAEVIQVVFSQFINLNIAVEHAGFIIDYKEHDDMHIWLADKHVFPSKAVIPYFDAPHWNSFIDAKQKRINFFVNQHGFEEKNSFYQKLFSFFPDVPQDIKDHYLSCPGLSISTVLLHNVGLYIENFDGIPFTDEENATLMRFGKVFQQAYTRFEDLQKAEAQAREAAKQAALDRIRADIASMRTTADLDRITPLIWNELTILGIPLSRCGVFIMDDAKHTVHSFLSSPNGKAIAAFHVPYQNEALSPVIAYWQNNKAYITHWDKTAFTAFADSLVKQGALDSSVQYLSTLPDEGFHLHFLPFLQGMFYVGSTDQLEDGKLTLIQLVADAFSTAYARYEDFNKLESAKQQVDQTLIELKQTQLQLIQAEKMASLGELTAGIAHEIQNPLNFVNNFSDVNKELITEMKEEIDKGNIDEAKAIANDIEENEKKINHHGKRADSIVKGMLQHSRQSTGQKEPTDINALVEEYLKLSYQALRSKDKSFNSIVNTSLDKTIGKIQVVSQDLGRVLLNLYNNAFYAVNEKKKKTDKAYEPKVEVTAKKLENAIEIAVMDNGIGIPQDIVDRIYNPFFTTKPTGEGTGLGLSLSYDIIKAHGGEILVETKDGEGTRFKLILPAK